MLSASSRPLIAASVPVLRIHGEAIARAMYATLFAEHPELRNVFNVAHQATGNQPASLGAALFAYAAHIDDAAALAPVAARIVHKHAALGVRPSHYPIVARHLLGAIQRVLGDAATPALLAAWDEAYWLLAGELIAAEATLYERSGHPPGALLPLTVVDARAETPTVRSLYLQTADRRNPGAFVPGQYVSVAAEVPSLGHRQLRQYSLSGGPSEPSWRLTVRRIAGAGASPAGAVSSYLHDVRPGAVLAVSPPFGEFAPLGDPARPLVLLSAGVGITPMVAALAALPAGSARPVWFAHAATSRADHVLHDDVHALAAARPGVACAAWYEDGPLPAGAARGRMALTAADLAPYPDADVYLCGPLAFMHDQWRRLLELGVPATHLHRERFGSENLDYLTA